MTSGNISEEPITTTNQEARQRLNDLADAFLMHNRDIYARYDDSVWFVPGIDQGASFPQPIRRARGYAPLPGVEARFTWKDIGAASPTQKPLQFWARAL